MTNDNTVKQSWDLSDMDTSALGAYGADRKIPQAHASLVLVQGHTMN